MIMMMIDVRCATVLSSLHFCKIFCCSDPPRRCRIYVSPETSVRAVRTYDSFQEVQYIHVRSRTYVQMLWQCMYYVLRTVQYD